MLVSLTVGKVDAGVAVLLTEDKRLIEFPSLLLPPSIGPGSIVDITVSLNNAAYAAATARFSALQSSILQTYGLRSPTPPVLRCLNTTQTSVVLEWDQIELAMAELRSLTLYRNGQKAGVIPEAKACTEGGGRTKVSGLALDTEYVFNLVLKTSAGMYHSERLVLRTHKMTDLSGIVVTPGILAPQLRSSLATAVQRIGARITETMGIETTHFVTTEGRGIQWERATEMNVPVVRPEWVEGCEREGRLVGVRGYYLGADPRLRTVGSGMGMGANRPQSQQGSTPKLVGQDQPQQFQPRPVPDRSRAESRSSIQQQPLASNPPTELKSPGFDPKPTPPAKDYPLRQSHHDSEPEGDGDGNDSERDTAESEDEAKEQRVAPEVQRPRDLGISGAAGDVSSDDEEQTSADGRGTGDGAGFQEVDLSQ